MAMQFIYGTFQGQPSDNWAYAGGSRTGVYKNGALASILQTVQYKFTIHADGQLALAARMQQIKNGIKYNGFNVGFLHDNNTPSHYFIDSSQTTSGVRITSYPWAQPEIPGADYATSLHGTCAFDAELLPEQIPGGGGVGSVLVSYAESLSVRGDGGPRTAIQEFITGPPERFTLCDQTPCYATQSGAAVLEGFSPSQFSTVSAPMFPDLLIHESKGERRNVEQLTNQKWQCSIEWEYNFESIGPIDGSSFRGRF